MPRPTLGWALAPIWLALAGPAVAQTVDTDEVSAVTFRPAPGTHRYLAIDGVDVGRRSDLPIGLAADWAFRPLYVDTFCGEAGIECDADVERVAVVEHLLAFHLGVALPIARRVELALSVPILYAAGDGWSFRDADGRAGAVRGGSAGGIGDPMLSARARVFGGEERGAGLAAVAFGTLPLGQLAMEGRHVGDDSLSVGGHLVAEALVDETRGAVMLGGLWRPPRSLASIDVGPMLTFGAAVEWRATEAASILGELSGGLGLGEATAQLELRGAGRLRLGSFEVTAGPGVGVVRGPGVPFIRLFAGLRWAPLPAADNDDDGVPDESDRCPDEAEDRDGFADEDGCPDLDDDGDGVPDESDRCPTEPEDRDGNADEDGCPDLDDDGDGVPDGYDSCLDEPEDHDGDRDDDGCPDVDRDRDGVPDDVDRCPDEAEDTDGLADEDGCPDTDADGDGIVDEQDECPEVPGVECDPEPVAPATGTGGPTAAPGTTEGPAAPPAAPDAGGPPTSDDGIDWTPP